MPLSRLAVRRSRPLPRPYRGCWSRPKHRRAPARGSRANGLINFVGRPARRAVLRRPFGPGHRRQIVENRVRVHAYRRRREYPRCHPHTFYPQRPLARAEQPPLEGQGHRNGRRWLGRSPLRGEPRQEGIISRLLEGERSISVGRFMAPGIAELEFWGRDRINLSTTFHLRQEDDQHVHGFGVLAGPVQGGIGYLKALLFKPLFLIALPPGSNNPDRCAGQQTAWRHTRDRPARRLEARHRSHSARRAPGGRRRPLRNNDGIVSRDNRAGAFFERRIRIKRTRQNNNLESGSDSIRTGKALG